MPTQTMLCEDHPLKEDMDTNGAKFAKDFFMIILGVVIHLVIIMVNKL